MWLALGFLSWGCTEPPPDASAEPAGQRSAPSARAAAALGDYCWAACERATRCGLDALSETAKGHPNEVDLVNEARDALSKDARACQASCAEGAPSASAELVDRASACLSQTDCETFASCLASVR